MDHLDPTGTRADGQDRAHHVAALIALGDHLVRAELVRRRADRPGPALGRASLHRPVGQHEGLATFSPHDHDAAGVSRRGRRRIDRHDDPVQFGRSPAPGPFQVRDAEQSALPLDHHAFQLLRRQPRPAIDVVQMRQKAGRQVLRVQRRRRPLRHRPGLGHQPPQRRDRPGRRGHRQQRRGPQPQSEPQVRQHHLRPSPGAELVRPGRMKLRPPQTVGILGRKRIGRRLIFPHQPTPPRFPTRPVARLRQRLDPRRPLHHHLAHIVQGGTDQGQGDAGQFARHDVDPDRPGEGLARPPAAQQQPGLQVIIRRRTLVLRHPTMAAMQP